MKKLLLIIIMIGLVVMIGGLYREGLRLAEDDLFPIADEQILLAASAYR